MTDKRGRNFYCWVGAEDREYLEQLVKSNNKAQKLKGRDAITVGSLCSAIVHKWVDQRKERGK